MLQSLLSMYRCHRCRVESPLQLPSWPRHCYRYYHQFRRRYRLSDVGRRRVAVVVEIVVFVPVVAAITVTGHVIVVVVFI